MIIIHGLAREKDEYRSLQKAISRYTRVLSYDRPGLGKSSSNSEPRTLDYMDKDLIELLQSKSVPPPYILIGHSMGGLLIRYFAHHHPELVAGLVFVDSSHEDWFPYIRRNWPTEDQEHYFQFWDDNHPEHTAVKREEKSAFEKNFEMVRGLNIREDLPVLVLSGGKPFRARKDPTGFEADRREWVDLHRRLLVGLKHTRHIVDLEWHHWLHHQEPDRVADEIAAFFRLSRKNTRADAVR